MRKICGKPIYKSKGAKSEYSYEFLLYNYIKNINPLLQRIWTIGQFLSVTTFKIKLITSQQQKYMVKN